MTNPIIQKLYDLSPEDLSSRLCEVIFGKTDIGEGKAQYKSEIKIDDKVIVKTYNSNNKEKGKALIITNHYKNTDVYFEGDINYIVQRSQIFIIADYDCYVDVRELALGDIFPVVGRYITEVGIDVHKPIYFLTEDHEDIGLEYEGITFRHENLSYYLDSSLTRKMIFGYIPTVESLNLIYTPSKVKEILPLRLDYIKASSKPHIPIQKFNNKTNFSFAEFYSRTKPGAELAGEGKLQVTFIPLESAKAFLGE